LTRSFIVLILVFLTINNLLVLRLGLLAGKLDEFAVLRESFREIIDDRFEVVMKAEATPRPMALGLATAGAAGSSERG
jgi:hypothetical protein